MKGLQKNVIVGVTQSSNFFHFVLRYFYEHYGITSYKSWENNNWKIIVQSGHYSLIIMFYEKWNTRRIDEFLEQADVQHLSYEKWNNWQSLIVDRRFEVLIDKLIRPHFAQNKNLNQISMYIKGVRIVHWKKDLKYVKEIPVRVTKKYIIHNEW